MTSGTIIMMNNKNQLESIISDPNLIKSLLPHREPMIMVDALLNFNTKGCVAQLTVIEQNILVHKGVLSEAGLMEHMAQTAALHSGYKQSSSNESVKEGFIAAIKSSHIISLPKTNEIVTTELEVIYEVAHMTIVKLSASVNNSIIATAEMSVVLNDKQNE